MENNKPSVIPVPATPSSELDEKRLWIGNLDSRITEYQLIKQLQKYGRVVKFDFLFHKSGPLEGQPRGYCFVTYETREQAKRALQTLGGLLAMSKRLTVKWAHLKIEDDDETLSCTTKSIMPGLTTAQIENDLRLNISTKIRAIEAKLKLMEEDKHSEVIIPPPLPSTYAQATVSRQSRQRTLLRHQNKPYHRHNQRRSIRSRKW